MNRQEVFCLFSTFSLLLKTISWLMQAAEGGDVPVVHSRLARVVADDTVDNDLDVLVVEQAVRAPLCLGLRRRRGLLMYLRVSF